MNSAKDSRSCTPGEAFMKAIQVHQFGGPEVLQMQKSDAQAGTRQVLVRVTLRA